MSRQYPHDRQTDALTANPLLQKEQPLTQLLFVTPDKINLADLSVVIETQGGTIS
jgi:hypothetical protein